VLYGDAATPQHIKNYYDGLRVDAQDAVAMYFCGHGALDFQYRHYMQLPQGPVYRSELLRHMKNKGGRLTVLISDCCSGLYLGKVAIRGYNQDDSGGVPWGVFSPVLRDLFFRHEGVVDITSAQIGTFAGCGQDGGYFTRSLIASLQLRDWQLDLDRDGFVSWKEVFDLVGEQTNREFMSRMSEAEKQKHHQYTQIPQAFDLGRRLVGPQTIFVQPAPIQAAVTGVVTIYNPTNGPIMYSLRWGSGAVQNFVLPAGWYNRHSHGALAESQVPLPQIAYYRRFQGDPVVGEYDFYNLERRTVTPPDSADLGRWYYFSIDPGPVVQLTDPEKSLFVLPAALPPLEPPPLLDTLQKVRTELYTGSKRPEPAPDPSPGPAPKPSPSDGLGGYGTLLAVIGVLVVIGLLLLWQWKRNPR
jgi:hypothetical protein